MYRTNTRGAARARGFTLIELLVVISIIGVLLSLMMPAVQQAREAARKTVCRNNLKQIGLALHNYESSHGVLPPGYIAFGVSATDEAHDETGPGFGWATMLLPQLDESPLYESMDFDLEVSVAAVTEPNLSAGRTFLPQFRCPTDNGPLQFDVHDEDDNELATVAFGNYVGVYGYGPISEHPGLGTGVLYRNSSERTADVKDGTTNTFAVGERSHKLANSTWFAAIPDGVFLAAHDDHGDGSHGSEHSPAHLLGHVGDDDHPDPPNGSAHGENFWSQHDGGLHFLLCDGSVKFIGENIDYRTYRLLGECRDGYPIGDY